MAVINTVMFHSDSVIQTREVPGNPFDVAHDILEKAFHLGEKAVVVQRLGLGYDVVKGSVRFEVR